MILSPADDFSSRTLAAVPGLLNKLDYVTGLRSTSGSYEHWGLSRSHGPAAANQTVAGAHADLFLQLLRTPLRELIEEVARMAEERGMKAGEVITSLTEKGETLIPQSLRGGSQRHFSSVLHSLSALARAQERRHSPTA